MEELYYEQIVEKENEQNISRCRVAIIAVILLLLAAGIVTGRGFLFLLAIAAGFVGFYFILPQLMVEYEYLYVSKELSVDKIYNKERRKKAGNWELANMEVMVPLHSDAIREYDNPKKTVLDFTSGINDENVYVIVMNDSKFTHILFEPGEEMLKAIRSQFPRQMKY